jgi:LysR family transcriptional regulator for metE and metH
MSSIAETGSLNAAAQRLHVTPSALSQQLKDLEEQLGGPLFHRHWRKLEPTAAGKRLTDSSRALLGELSRSENEVRQLAAGTAGTLRVATECQHSYGWLPQVLGEFHKTHENVEVAIVADGATSPCQLLVEGRLDLAITTAEMGRHSELEYEPLFRDELVVIAPRKHALSASGSVSFDAFANEHLWLDAGALNPRTSLARALSRAKASPKKVSVVPAASGVALEMVRAGLGVTVVPRWTVTQLAGHSKLRPIRLGPRGIWLEWFVATRAGKDPALEALLVALRANHPGERRAAGKKGRS